MVLYRLIMAVKTPRDLRDPRQKVELWTASFLGVSSGVMRSGYRAPVVHSFTHIIIKYLLYPGHCAEEDGHGLFFPGASRPRGEKGINQ